jgi:putative endonuclease
VTESARDGRAARGAWAEDAACRFLQARGLQPVARNYRCPHGEIDLVLRDGAELVFAEVRYRGGGAWVEGVESVDLAKRRRLLASAEHFLQRHHEHTGRGCRFDVLGVTGGRAAPRFEWVQDAFGA